MSNPPTNIEEYSIRVPKNIQKKYHRMRFNSNLKVEFDKWTQVKMERENNMKDFKGNEEEQPKSEFGREAKEARCKKISHRRKEIQTGRHTVVQLRNSRACMKMVCRKMLLITWPKDCCLRNFLSRISQRNSKRRKKR